MSARPGPARAAPDQPPGERRPAALGPWAAWGEGSYRRYAAGFFASGLGLQMLSTAALWEVYARTDSPLLVGLVGLARALPVVVLALPAGHLADIGNRQRQLGLTQLGMAGVAVGLSWASWTAAPLWTIYALMVLTGVCRALGTPARNSILPQLVGEAKLPNAVTWNANLFQISAISGPLLAGWIISSTGAGPDGQGAGAAWPVYVFAAGGSLVFSAASLTLRPRAVARRGAVERFSMSAVFAGAAYIRRERVLFGAIGLDLLAVLFGGATALLPIFAADILDAGPTGLGVLRASPYVGALACGLALTRTHAFTRTGPVLLMSVAGFGVCTIIFGLSEHLWLSAAALAAAGACDQVSVVVRHLLVQLRTPDELRGRVAAVNAVFIECSNELGAFESGLVAEWFGAVVSAVSGGVGTLLVVAGVSAGVPELRRLGALRSVEAEQRLGAPEPPASVAGPGTNHPRESISHART